MKMKTKRFGRYIIMTLCLVICLSVVLITASKYITDLTISDCFQRLRDSTNQYILDIRQEVEADGNLMEAIADYFGQGGSVDSEKNWKYFHG